MPRPDPRRPKEGQTTMFGGDVPTGPPPGKYGAMVAAAIDAADDQGLITPVDGAAVALVLAAAEALDMGVAQSSPWVPAKIIEPTLNALRELHMTPAARTGSDDGLMERLARELAGNDAPADHGDPAISHPGQP